MNTTKDSREANRKAARERINRLPEPQRSTALAQVRALEDKQTKQTK